MKSNDPAVAYSQKYSNMEGEVKPGDKVFIGKPESEGLHYGRNDILNTEILRVERIDDFDGTVHVRTAFGILIMHKPDLIRIEDQSPPSPMTGFKTGDCVELGVLKSEVRSRERFIGLKFGLRGIVERVGETHCRVYWKDLNITTIVDGEYIRVVDPQKEVEEKSFIFKKLKAYMEEEMENRKPEYSHCFTAPFLDRKFEIKGYETGDSIGVNKLEISIEDQTVVLYLDTGTEIAKVYQHLRYCFLGGSIIPNMTS